MARHVDDRELLLSFDRELAGARHQAVSRHLDLCHACRERADSLRGALHAAEAFCRAEYATDVSGTDDRRVRLAAALHEAASVEPGWFQRLFGGGALSRRLAAGGVVMAVCALFMAVRVATGPAADPDPWGFLPEATLTPGAVAALTADELCNGVRPSRLVPAAVRRQVVRAYDMGALPPDAYELDALITPELGGSTDAANLWPQRYHSPVWNAYVKDALERLLPELVCSRQITLAEAQNALAVDWIAAYKRYFRTDAPLRAHLDAAEDEEPELVVIPDGPAPRPAMLLAGR